MPDTPFRDVGDPVDDTPRLPIGRSVIVVIGIDQYAHHPALTNAVSDANAVFKLFKRCGFEELAGVPSLFDSQATLNTLTELVGEQLRHGLKPEDSLVLFFAGHGATVASQVPDPKDASKMLIRRTGYLIPVEAREGKPSDWFRLDAFLAYVSDLPARHVLVILDACKSGFALSEELRFRGEGQVEGTFAELAGRVSRRVMTSAMHDQKAMDGGGSGNSLFTETLVDAVDNLGADRDGDGYITETELFSFVRQQVADRAAREHQVEQTPDYGQLSGDGRGELVLSLRGDTYNRQRAEETLKVADHIYALGWLSGDTKRFASAHRYFKQAYELAALGKMALPAAKLGYGKALLAMGHADEAAKELAALVRDAGEAFTPEMNFYLGLARAKCGEFAAAAEALRAFQNMCPECPDAAWTGAYADWLARAASPEAGRKLALLIGINQYSLPGLTLNGCVNDVERLMKPALLAHGGFREDDVTCLTNAFATRQRVVEEFRKLQAHATLSDAVIVHYSGHAVASSQPDGFGKNDVENVYLILHDTHNEPGYLTNGITADELHQLMQDIPTGRKTLILDTHASERLIDLARREGSYALILASDTAELAYEWHVDVGGESVDCGMLTGALYQSLAGIDDYALSYGEWIASAIRIAEAATSNRDIYQKRQTPFFSGFKNQQVFGPDDIFMSVFEFSQRREWPALDLDELTRFYSLFCHSITVPHPLAHHAFGRAFLTKGAHDQAIAALQTAVAQAGDAVPANLFSLGLAQFQAGHHADALATLQRYAPLARSVDRPVVNELTGILEQLANSRKHAILVGIDQYASPEVPALRGALNDVAALKRVLLQRWGFQEQDIVELVDDKATRASILAELGRLIAVARREPALFFFAGHGSRGDNRLPTLVPYDGRQADVPDIALEELARLIGKDATYLTLILDTDFSSHSLKKNSRSLVSRYADMPAPGSSTAGEWLAQRNALPLGDVVIYQNIRPS